MAESPYEKDLLAKEHQCHEVGFINKYVVKPRTDLPLIFYS